MAITIPILTDFNGRGIDRGVKQFQQLEGKGAKAGFAIRKAFLPAVAVLGGMALMAKQGVQGVMEDEAAVANLEATLKSTGNAVNTTAQGFFEFANRLQDTTGESAALITQGGAMLATFKNVRNEMGKGNQIFDRATVAALDLSKKGFGSLESSNKMLGKALNDPVRGITALSRAGVTFTDQQKKTIASLVASGKTLEAQKIILKEVEDQVGGTAEAMGKTLQGQIERGKRSFEELQKSLATALIPVIEFLAKVFRNLTGFMRENEGITKAVIAVLGVLAGAIVAARVAMGVYNTYTTLATVASKAFAAVQWLVNAALTANPIGIVVAALAALAGAIYLAWTRSGTFREIVLSIWEAMKPVAEFIGKVFAVAWKVLSTYIEVAVTVIGALIDAVATVFGGLKAFGKWVSDKAGPLFRGLATAAEIAIAPILAIVNAIKWIARNVNKLNPFGRELPERIKEDWAALSATFGQKEIPGMAHGGIVTQPTVALIGEAGPEAVIPLNRRGAMGMTINVQAGLVSTPDQIGQQIIEAIQRAERRSGPAFMPA